MSDHRKGEATIVEFITNARQQMTIAQRRLWDAIAIAPQQWVYSPHVGPQSTIWIVAIMGSYVICYDDYYGEITTGLSSRNTPASTKSARSA